MEVTTVPAQLTPEGITSLIVVIHLLPTDMLLSASCPSPRTPARAQLQTGPPSRAQDITSHTSQPSHTRMWWQVMLVHCHQLRQQQLLLLSNKQPSCPPQTKLSPNPQRIRKAGMVYPAPSKSAEGNKKMGICL